MSAAHLMFHEAGSNNGVSHMGYTTRFTGKLTISPALSFETFKKVNAFIAAPPPRTVPWVFNCDWCLNASGTELAWNGSEKSYSMDEWLKIINERFIAPEGCTLSGTVYAHGDEANDQWKIVCTPDAEQKCTKIEIVRRPTEW